MEREYLFGLVWKLLGQRMSFTVQIEKTTEADCDSDFGL